MSLTLRLRDPAPDADRRRPGRRERTLGKREPSTREPSTREPSTRACSF
ncbi:hypothetical protein [Nonomuraea turkmeniaca]|nr:hypothetical protein [Nonomuraea turkmeniaca]